jgi:hypothetical protein
VLPPGLVSAGGQPRWLVARSLCRFRHFTLPVAAGPQRRAVLRNLLLAWAPFDDARYSLVIAGDSAFAWAWDRGRALAMLAQASSGAPARLFPEALVAAPPPGDGVRLVRALEGVDGQVWRRGELIASRWWPAAPAQQDWARWVRAAASESAVNVDESVPGTQEPVWQAPWAEGMDVDALLSSTSRLERVALGAALAGLVGLTSAQVHQAWVAYGERQVLTAERDRLEALAAPVVGARDRALTLTNQVALLTGQLAAPAPLEVLQHLAERLPARGVTLKELELSGTRLRLGLEVATDLPRTALVKDLQAAGWFVQVTEVRDPSGRGWLGFEMQVQGLRPPVGDPGNPVVSRAVSPSAPGMPGSPGAQDSAGFPLLTSASAGPTAARP